MDNLTYDPVDSNLLHFPNTTVAVNGPFAHLTIRASGAFAAYLVIFVGTVPLVNKIGVSIGGLQTEQIWTLNGKFFLVDEEQKPVKYQVLLDKIEWSLKPSQHDVSQSDFRMKLVKTGAVLPLIAIKISEFGEGSISTNNILEGPNVDHYHHIITLQDPIMIRKSGNIRGPIEASAK